MFVVSDMISSFSLSLGTADLQLGTCSVPADRRLVQIDVYLLGLEILLNSPGPQLPSEAGLLESSPGRFHISRLHVVDPNNPRAQGFHRTHGLEDIASPDRRCQPIGGIIRNLHRILLVFEGN